MGFRVASVCRAHYTGVYIYSETEGYLHPQFYICTEEVAELSVNDFLSSLSTNALHTAYDVLNEDFLFICTQNFGVKSPSAAIAGNANFDNFMFFSFYIKSFIDRDAFKSSPLGLTIGSRRFRPS